MKWLSEYFEVEPGDEFRMNRQKAGQRKTARREKSMIRTKHDEIIMEGM